VKPDDLRNQLLAEHDELRQALEKLERLAARVLTGSDDQIAALRAEAAGFLDALLTHMEWEDVDLAQAVRDAGAGGENLAAKLARDHSEQRELLEHVLRGLSDASRPVPIVARNLLDLCSLLRDDMVEEEEMLIKAGVLRGDAAPPDREERF
jgi:DNA-binding NarL/FixJ family response regulator